MTATDLARLAAGIAGVRPDWSVIEYPRDGCSICHAGLTEGQARAELLMIGIDSTAELVDPAGQVVATVPRGTAQGMLL